MTVGDRIRARRTELGLTQADVSSRGVSAQYVSKVERGERNPSMKALRHLAVVLHTTPHWLETGQDEVLVPVRPAEARRLANGEVPRRVRVMLREMFVDLDISA